MWADNRYPLLNKRSVRVSTSLDKKDKEGDKICFEMNQGELKDMILELGKVKSAVEKAIE